MIRNKKWRLSSCIEINWSDSLAYMLSHVGSRFWEFDYKRRIQDMALCGGHDALMSWAMVDQYIEHAIKWLTLYVPQDILIEHVEIQGWPGQRSNIRFEISQHIKHKNMPHGMNRSYSMVRFIYYALLTNPWYMCLVLSMWVRYFLWVCISIKISYSPWDDDIKWLSLSKLRCANSR
jgi:hypothetical protein